MSLRKEIAAELSMMLLNDRLNFSEALLRKEIGARKLNALVRKFKAAAKDKPKLWRTLYKQPDPYRWLAEKWAARTPIPQPGQGTGA